MATTTFDLTSAVGMQQSLPGSGYFTGSYVGRASVDIGGGGTLVRYRAQSYGTDGNNLTVEQYDVGAPTVVPTTTVQLTGTTAVRVILRRSSGAILATADEVAAAINNFQNTNNPTQKLPVVAHNGGTSVVSAAAPTPLTGGLDPQLVAPLAKWTTTSNGGLFYFDQTEPIVVMQMSCAFANISGSQTIQFQLANLDAGLEPIAAETATLFSGDVSSSQPYVSFADSKFIMLPYQAFLIVAPPTIWGVAQVITIQLANFLTS
jgi:hypothetical protein